MRASPIAPFISSTAASSKTQSARASKASNDFQKTARATRNEPEKIELAMRDRKLKVRSDAARNFVCAVADFCPRAKFCELASEQGDRASVVEQLYSVGS